jgi:hypothetical protein
VTSSKDRQIGPNNYMEIQLSKQEKNMSICVAWPKVAKTGRARCFHRAKLLIVVITKFANGNMPLKV